MFSMTGRQLPVFYVQRSTGEPLKQSVRPYTPVEHGILLLKTIKHDERATLNAQKFKVASVRTNAGFALIEFGQTSTQFAR